MDDHDVIKTCYARCYSNKQQKCIDCKLSYYCRDAMADENNMFHNSNEIEYNDAFESMTDDDQFEYTANEIMLLELFKELMVLLVTIKLKKPKWHYNVIIDKIQHPELSYAVLGAKYRKSFQAVYHVFSSLAKKAKIIKKIIHIDRSRIKWKQGE